MGSNNKRATHTPSARHNPPTDVQMRSRSPLNRTSRFERTDSKMTMRSRSRSKQDTKQSSMVESEVKNMNRSSRKTSTKKDKPSTTKSMLVMAKEFGEKRNNYIHDNQSTS